MSDPITATTSGTTDSVYLPPGEWTAILTSPEWGETIIEVSRNNIQWFVAEDEFGQASFTANSAVEIPGNSYYRLNAASIVDPITIEFHASASYSIANTRTQIRRALPQSRAIRNNEQLNLSFYLTDTDGVPVRGLFDREIYLVIEKPNTEDIVVYRKNQMAISEGTITVYMDDQISEVTGSYNWAIREEGTEILYAQGTFSVVYAPIQDV